MAARRALTTASVATPTQAAVVARRRSPSMSYESLNATMTESRPSPSWATAHAAESINAEALYSDGGAALDDLREAVTTLEETERTARRVLGGAHPTTSAIEEPLQHARARLRAYETPSGSA